MTVSPFGWLFVMWMWRSVPWDDRRTNVIDTGEIGAFLGPDVGKGEHHATAVTPAGKKASGKRLPHSEPRLRAVFGKLQAGLGTVLVVVLDPCTAP